jgi:hypothetical protein
MRASTHLRLARLGLVDMESADHDRILLGYFTVAVFGRSCTLALQRLKHWDEAAFLKWYEPWATAMKNDPLCQFFYELRTEIVHGVTPIPGVMLAAFGPSAPQVGAIYIPEDKVPTEHKGQPIEDRSARNLSRLYVEYLQENFRLIPHHRLGHRRPRTSSVVRAVQPELAEPDGRSSSRRWVPCICVLTSDAYPF